MADEKSPMDYDEHNKTFAMFIMLTKVSSAIIIAVLILMAIFLV